jgi:ribosomal protein S19E (S16A)
MQSIEKQILEKIKKTSRGLLIFAEDFYSLGSAEAVRLALHRLEKKREITRVAQGIYVRPKVSELIGETLPSAEEVAAAIAKRDRIRTIPTGAYALNALGLSTQVPMKIVMLTDGSPRIVKVGKRTINFKRASSKTLLAKGAISRLVIQALKEIGINNQTDAEEVKIIQLLKGENKEHLLHDIPLAPVWIQKIMKKAML